MCFCLMFHVFSTIWDENTLCECAQDGITIKFGVQDRMWCCKTTGDQCITEGHNTICNGTALSLSDQCHDEYYNGPSCNYYPLDQFRYYSYEDAVYRSYIDLCQDNRYLKYCKAGSKKFV